MGSAQSKNKGTEPPSSQMPRMKQGVVKDKASLEIRPGKTMENLEVHIQDFGMDPQAAGSITKFEAEK